jgi:hypothetical protein
MKHPTRDVRRRLCAATAAATATALVCAGFAGGSAIAEPGDTYFVSTKSGTDHAFVSYVVRAGSDQATEFLYGTRNVPCKGAPGPQRIFKTDGSADITDGAFKQVWEGYGGVSGQINGDSASGKVRLRISFRRENGRRVTRASGRRHWSGKPVSEQRWLDARENALYR